MKISNLIKIVSIFLLVSSPLVANITGTKKKDVIKPFDTELKVTNLTNSKFVTVHINDGCINQESCLVRLSLSDAKKLGILTDRTAQKNIEKTNIKSPKVNSEEMATLEKMMLEEELQENPYLSSEDEKLMQAYALESTARTSKSSFLAKVQIAAFNNEKSAQNFITKVNTNGFEMDILEQEVNSKLFYKVVILCHSNNEAQDVLESKQYAGAYVLK